jgi:hypothetical protein
MLFYSLRPFVTTCIVACGEWRRELLPPASLNGGSSVEHLLSGLVLFHQTNRRRITQVVPALKIWNLKLLFSSVKIFQISIRSLNFKVYTRMTVVLRLKYSHARHVGVVDDMELKVLNWGNCVQPCSSDFCWYRAFGWCSVPNDHNIYAVWSRGKEPTANVAHHQGSGGARDLTMLSRKKGKIVPVLH